MWTLNKILSEFKKKLPRIKYLISDKFTSQCIEPLMKNPMKEMIEKQLSIIGIDCFDIN